METSRRTCLLALGALILPPPLASVRAQPGAGQWTDADKEALLREGAIISSEEIGHGVTRPVKVGLRWKGAVHAAKVQTVDKALPDFFGEDGTVVPMTDSWRFNIAAYRIDRLLNLGMVPVVVARAYNGAPGAFTWWVDDVKGEEAQRLQEHWAPPDPERFERQRALANVFDELIVNIDRNLANLLITNAWELALIDHTRAFTAYHNIRNRENLTRCSRALLSRMSALTTTTVARAAGTSLTRREVAALIARRDRIVAFFKELAARNGEDRVFFP